MSVDFTFKDKYGIDDLTEIVRILRAPGGCPWDAEQTHKSLRKDFIEETYEVIEAINKDDSVMLTEELGDVLLQVVFHVQLAKEEGRFGFDDVTDGICKKLILRHPHVFGDTVVDGVGDVLSNWDSIKRKEKHQKSVTDSMLSVPRELPALMRGQKIQSKAAKAGFDWDNIDGAYDKIYEETAELREAAKNESKERVLDELGDVLFSVVNVARFLDIDAEEALTHSVDKFLSRFSVVEKLAEERNIDMKSADIKMLDELWDEAKKG